MHVGNPAPAPVNGYLFASLFFLANIILVVQIVPVANFLIADRYNYISSVGFFLLMGTAFSWIVNRNWKWKWPIIGTGLIYVIMLSSLCHMRCGVWCNSITLWNDVLGLYPDSVFALNMRGCAKVDAGLLDAALEDFAAAVDVSRGRDDRAFLNRGVVREKLGDFSGALADYDRAIDLRSDNPLAFNNRGLIKHRLGDYQGALSDFNRAVESKRDRFLLYLFYGNRAITKNSLADYVGAIADTSAAVRMRPNYYLAYHTRGMAKWKMGDSQGALMDMNSAVDIAPDNPLAYVTRSELKSSLGDDRGSIDDYKRAMILRSPERDSP
jgi:tetratricopeptide (TPR) repeat protein